MERLSDESSRVFVRSPFGRMSRDGSTWTSCVVDSQLCWTSGLLRDYRRRGKARPQEANGVKHGVHHTTPGAFRVCLVGSAGYVLSPVNRRLFLSHVSKMNTYTQHSQPPSPPPPLPRNLPRETQGNHWRHPFQWPCRRCKREGPCFRVFENCLPLQSHVIRTVF